MTTFAGHSLTAHLDEHRTHVTIRCACDWAATVRIEGHSVKGLANALQQAHDRHATQLLEQQHRRAAAGSEARS